MNTLEKQFEHHFQVIRNKRFREGIGLGNEVPFFISTFPAEDQVEADKLISFLHQRLLNEGIPIILINLFELCIDFLENEGVLEDYIEHEPNINKNNFLHDLGSELNIETNLTPKIMELVAKEPQSILFINGVGQVYPLIRTHSILSNLQTIARNQPTVLFFPGIYKQNKGVGSVLDLFGKLDEDRYYRAFSLNEHEI